MAKIHELKKEYIPAIAEIEAECFPDPASEKGLEAFLEDPLGGICLVESGKVVSYATFVISPDDIQIANLATASSERNKGYATEIMKHICETAIKDHKLISLEVRESNTIAIEMYKRFGFEIRGRRPDFYRAPVEDALIMIFDHYS